MLHKHATGGAMDEENSLSLHAICYEDRPFDLKDHSFLAHTLTTDSTDTCCLLAWHLVRISETKRIDMSKRENTHPKHRMTNTMAASSLSITQTEAFLIFTLLVCLGCRLSAVSYARLLRRRRFSVCCTLFVSNTHRIFCAVL